MFDATVDHAEKIVSKPDTIREFPNIAVLIV
jgi:hypothetical protein